MLPQDWNNFAESTKDRGPVTFLKEAVSILKGKGGKALDIGCGSGADAKYLGESGFEVQAIDTNQQSVKVARELCRGLPVKIFEEDATRFAIQPEEFEIVHVWHTLPFIPKQKAEKLLAHVEKGLKIGGCFVFGIFGPEDDWSKQGKITFWTMEEFKGLLTKLRFVKLTEKKEEGKTVEGRIKFWHKIQGLAQRIS